jgi:hypothetical protein
MCATVATLAASDGAGVSVGERARGAKAVVVGSVEDVTTRFETNQWGDRLIVSDAVVHVEETLKGSSAGVVTMTVEGGTIGDLTLSVSDIPTIERGERAVLFLEEDAQGRHRPHRRGLGILKLDRGNRVRGNGMTLDEVRRQVRSSR